LLSETPVSSADTLWLASTLGRENSRSRPYVRSILPLELKRVILGFCTDAYILTQIYVFSHSIAADGYLRSASFAEILHGLDVGRCPKSDYPLGSGITGLYLTHDHKKELCVVGSSEDGTLGVWDLE
jgi:hypothetical protein